MLSHYSKRLYSRRSIISSSLSGSVVIPPTDSAAESVTLLMHFDGANGSTVFTDVKGHTVTGYGNAALSTAKTMIGTSCLALDGTGDYLVVTPKTGALDDFLFTGDFTIECKVIFNSISGAPQTLFGMKSGASYFDLSWYGSSDVWQVSLNAGSGTAISPSGVTYRPVVNTLVDVALVRISGTLKLYINGIATGTSISNSSTLGFSNINAYISGSDAETNVVNGYIDEMRITNGVGRYSANYPPSTVAFPNPEAPPAATSSIGVQGSQGFGVGVYPTTLPSGFTAMSGATDPTNANYGNYQYSDGSVMSFVPKFYYRIGNASSPRYATYGANAVDIADAATYADETAANAAGFALHRAFKDGGAVKSGFFIDKYLASKNGTTSCKSVQNGVPISLTALDGYTNSNGMTTGEGSCTGIYADAVLLARSRGVGTFNVASVFMYSALSLLALAHAQASSNTTYCAWYDATNNFPKGCNNGSLADTNDAGVTFTTTGDQQASVKPKTGSGSPFAKTTHNGQSCGVADLNGALNQVMLGITNAGTSASDSTQKTNGDAYVLKTTVALASLTHGWNGTNDAWGDATNLATKYDAVTGLFPWGDTTGTVYFGSGSNQVFSGATSGVGWNRTACGIQSATNSADATGTNQFGNDFCYQSNCANNFTISGGAWNQFAGAGVFCKIWGHTRATGGAGRTGFRAAAYGS